MAFFVHFLVFVVLTIVTCLLGDYIATEFPGRISFAAITKTWIKEVLREILQQKQFENQCKKEIRTKICRNAR